MIDLVFHAIWLIADLVYRVILLVLICVPPPFCVQMPMIGIRFLVVNVYAVFWWVISSICRLSIGDLFNRPSLHG